MFCDTFKATSYFLQLPLETYVFVHEVDDGVDKFGNSTLKQINIAFYHGCVCSLALHGLKPQRFDISKVLQLKEKNKNLYTEDMNCNFKIRIKLNCQQWHIGIEQVGRRRMIGLVGNNFYRPAVER